MSNIDELKQQEETARRARQQAEALEAAAHPKEIKQVFAPVPGTEIESKQFYLTSEFWVLVGAGVQTVINGAHDPKSLIINGIAAVYALSRGFAKAGVAHKVR